MFDGQHRSRRQVNLSSSAAAARRRQQRRQKAGTAGTAAAGIGAGTAAGASSSRETILEESRVRREERRQQQLRQRAAFRIQSIFRGHASRRRLSRALDDRLDNQHTPLLNVQEHAAVLNFRLALRIPENSTGDSRANSVNDDDRFLLLSRYLDNFSQVIYRAEQQSQAALMPPPLCHRIIWAALRLARRQQQQHLLTVLRYCFCLLPSTTTERQQMQQQQQQQLQAFNWKQLGGAAGYANLLETVHVLDGGSGNVQQQPVVELVWELAAASTPANSPAGKAALTALLLSSRKKLFDADSNNFSALFDTIRLRRRAETGGDPSRACSVRSNADLRELYYDWFIPFVGVLSSPQQPRSPGVGALEEKVNQVSVLVGLAVKQIEANSQITILSNALDLYYRLSSPSSTSAIPDGAATTAMLTKPVDPSPVLRLLQRVFEERSNLALLASLQARGDDVQAALTEPEPSSQSEGDTGDDEDDGMSDEEMDNQHVRAPSIQPASRQQQRVGGRLTKQELLTVPKIDRNYHSEVSRWRTEVITNLRSNAFTPEQRDEMIRLASQISDGEQWVSWGMALLSESHDSEELWLAQEAYITMLASMLQSTTGLKARQNQGSPLLGKLAFQKGFVEKLWRYILVQATNKSLSSQNTYVAFSVFADVFTHRLIGLTDDMFLANHTTMRGSCEILAENVIVRFRDVLYELYWNKPVRAADVRVPFGRSMAPEQRFEAVRGRLLLTGTKVWQALYERWCRLLRHAPFCDEGKWLFPSMTMSVPGENRVAHMERQQPHGLGGDNDNMDLDSDGSDTDDDEGDEPMSILDAETEDLANAFGDPKMARILTCVPQALPFERRVKLFSSLLEKDKLLTQNEAEERLHVLRSMMQGDEPDLTGRERVSIRRDQLYEDSMRQLNQLGPKLRRRVQVSFINQHGAQEAGIDGGGVFKEFIDDLLKEAFSPETEDGTTNDRPRLFTVTSLQTLAVNPGLTRDPDLLPHYEFLGRATGKAVYESILVEPQFCLPFLNQLLGKTNSLEDLKNYDPEYYNNLTKLLMLTPDAIDNAGLAFETTLGEGPSLRTAELIPGGKNIPVTKRSVIKVSTHPDS